MTEPNILCCSVEELYNFAKTKFLNNNMIYVCDGKNIDCETIITKWFSIDEQNICETIDEIFNDNFCSERDPIIKCDENYVRIYSGDYYEHKGNYREICNLTKDQINIIENHFDKACKIYKKRLYVVDCDIQGYERRMTNIHRYNIKEDNILKYIDEIYNDEYTIYSPECNVEYNSVEIISTTMEKHEIYNYRIIRNLNKDQIKKVVKYFNKLFKK